MKTLIKAALKKAGYSLHRSAPGVVAGLDLSRDLPIAVGGGPGLLCIDAGANVGEFTSLLLSSLDHPSVHAFEPAPSPFEKLARRFEDTPGITAINAGLGAADGEIEFNIYENQHLNSALVISNAGKSTLGGAGLSSRIRIPVRSLDSYASTTALTNIDLLKIDTQGFEMHVLKGADGLFGRRAIRSVLVELNFAPLYEGQVWGHQVMEFLHEHGFGLVDFYERCRLNPHLGWCTALFALRPGATA